MEKIPKEDIVEEEITYYIFIKSGRRYFNPQYVAVGATTVQWIFPVPEPNAVGTLDEESNGIVFIKFSDYGKAPESQIIAQNFSSMVYGPFIYRFSPSFTEEMVVYSKTRDAVIVNVIAGEAFHVEFDIPPNEYMLGIRFLDPQNNLFVIVKSTKGDKPYRDDSIHVVSLEDQQFIDAGWNIHLGETHRVSSEFPLHHTWFVHDKKLFVYDQARHQILCTNGYLPVVHPFSEIFNNNSRCLGRVKSFAIHPNLPFGVIIDENAYEAHGLALLRWDITNSRKKDESILTFGLYLEELKSLFSMDCMALAYQSFSPDGNWYVVGCIAPDAPQKPYFVAVPVYPADEQYPEFLDMNNLVLLGRVTGMTSIAWTSEPTSYVVSNGELLHKWDLDELSNARVFVMPEDNAGNKKVSIFRKFIRIFGLWK
jgi:hypothetical protein